MRFRWLVPQAVLVAALLLLVGSSASATPLGLIPAAEPDIFYDFATVDYNAGTDTLTVTGFAENIDAMGVVDATITGGGFSLTATVDGSGVLSAGTFTVTGTVNFAPFFWNSGTLLTGTLNAIGFPDGVAGALEFTFSTSGGDAAGEYGAGGGLTVGIVNGFPGDWTSNFHADFNAVGDVFVPEPSTGLMLAFGLGLISFRRRLAA